VPQQETLEKAMEKEIERMFYPERFNNRLIYDSLEDSHFHQVFQLPIISTIVS